jgi:hypothetical protein
MNWGRRKSRRLTIAWSTSCLAVVVVVAIFTSAATAELLTNSRSPYVHWLNLMDDQGQMINPRDRDAQPYSPSATCTQCHNVSAINHGYHFNANRADARAGRPGEPWIVTDMATRTQVPLTYRHWPGTFTPGAVGMDEWQFTRQFGRHLPGGGPAVPSADSATPTASARWNITGSLENDCMICHSRGASYDIDQRARQIADENFKWAPTAALGLGKVVGEAASVPDDFDPEFPEFTPDAKPPRVIYDASKINADNRVFFDIVRKPPVERCYQCHTSHESDPISLPRWQRDTDVHVLAGMSCADCHRHGIEHDMVRGYPGESAVTDVHAASALSCTGCHLGEQTSNDPQTFGGRLGAPIPQHRGIPPLHFQALSCTACHSGPWPARQSQGVQTSMAHGLGLGDEHRRDTDPPHIAQPVFVRNARGQIEPCRMIWPAYWGVLERDKVRPLPLEDTRQTIIGFLKDQSAEPSNEVLPAKEAGTRQFATLSADQLAAALCSLQSELAEGQTAVYISGGKLHRMDGDALIAIDHAAGAPYAWPLGHDVRPAGQSLGVRGCMDCHAHDSPFIAGLVAALPASPNGPVIKAMHELQQQDLILWNVWARGFYVRSVFKTLGFIAAGLVAIMLLWVALQMISAVHAKRKRSLGQRLVSHSRADVP